MRRTVSVLGGVALAVLFGQFPEYAQQYVQRLGGAVDELRIITAEFDRGAAEAGLSRETALDRYEGVGDSFVAGRGIAMRHTVLRYEQLSASLADIEGKSGLERFSLLPRYFDPEISRRALEAYQPAMPVTIEGFAYAGAGFAIGYLALSGLVRFLMLPFRRRRTVRPEGI